MLPSFMPLKGVGLEPSYTKRAVCLQRLGLQSSSGTGQGKGTGANQVAPTGPSSGRLWVLSLHCCLWLHLAQKESPGIWGRAEEGWNTSSLGPLRNRVWKVALWELRILKPFTWASVDPVRQGFELNLQLHTPTPVLSILKLKF